MSQNTQKDNFPAEHQLMFRLSFPMNISIVWKEDRASRQRIQVKQHQHMELHKVCTYLLQQQLFPSASPSPCPERGGLRDIDDFEKLLWNFIPALLKSPAETCCNTSCSILILPAVKCTVMYGSIHCRYLLTDRY